MQADRQSVKRPLPLLVKFGLTVERKGRGGEGWRVPRGQCGGGRGRGCGSISKVSFEFFSSSSFHTTTIPIMSYVTLCSVRLALQCLVSSVHLARTRLCVCTYYCDISVLLMTRPEDRSLPFCMSCLRLILCYVFRNTPLSSH